MHLPSSSKGISSLILRTSFGLSLLFVGLTHYMTLDAFAGMVTEGLGPLGTVWTYVLSALMIVGGALFTIGMYSEIAAWTAGIALGSIPVGMLVKPVLTGVPLGDMMGPAMTALVWLLVYMWVVKCSSCCGGSCDSSGKM
jgi:uncharacterized membrane protein